MYKYIPTVLTIVFVLSIFILLLSCNDCYIERFWWLWLQGN